MRIITPLFLLLSASSVAWAGHPPIPMEDYVIQKGDTCASIAKARYGDGDRYDIIHDFNPQLGAALPHRHTPGDVLRLPIGIPPDAWVTAVVRRVEQRAASASAWQPAAQGSPLKVGHRVSTHARSAAELTFKDDATVELLENTLLVVFGRSADEAQVRPQRARLEQGSLRSRLAELRGEALGLEITAGTAEASWDASATVMSVDGEGLVCVSNHDGGEVAVRSTAVPGRPVAVPAGQGTRVPKGRAPEPPRPLPAPPRWGKGAPAVAWGADGPSAVITAEWAGPPEAAAWRLDISKAGVPVASAELPLDRPTVRLTGLPAGQYALAVSTQDRSGLVSRPSALKAIEVRALTAGATVPPGALIGGCYAAEGPPAPEVVAPAAPGALALRCGDAALTVNVGGAE